ncbi:hypothetical protein GCM10010106_11400 [Thermopolyspora flexuosa]|uniref:Tetratricopeptide repeat protein n=1 Tax=Thermopolyspora flexuosa TaxID=103836 RepID=A0A543J0P4_9ACTN|nr:tetratricopeptide repeat protein [Thermopolyspora flexuosa]TQM76391.1 hypothetical protein FHX40_3125 [Thermopolyspora flexuosa]GGM67005.1 hypothetical protein GCM10010106_11400 [Thermopolyspora flexuosa]
MDVDIWAWVGDTQRQLYEAGNAGLALALGDLPAQALEGRYAQLDVMAPAVAQQAGVAGQPWLEFFARYWHLIGRIGDRAQGEVALEDARALVEFARRDEVRDCPAAPAAVEALAIALANTDGPRYAAERLAVLGTALDGMGPDSPAYTGLTTQYILALLDAGTAQEAVAYSRSVTERLRAAEKAASWELAAAGVRALLAVGAAEDALALLDEATAFKPDDPVAKERRERLLRARVLTALNRLDEAVEALPDLDVIDGHPRDWVEWAQVVDRLGFHGKITNSWQLGRVLRQWADYFATMGGHRARVEVLVAAAALAIGRQGVWQARLLVEDAAEGLRRLEKAESLAEEVEVLRQRAEQATPPKAPAPRNELVGAFDAADGITADPERWVEWLWPLSGEDLAATRRHTTTLGFLGYPAVGADIYWRMIVENGDPATADAEDIGYLTSLLLDAGQDEKVERLAERLPAGPAHLARARLHRRRERWEETAREAEAAVEAGIGMDARRLWAGAVQQLGDNAKAAGIIKDVLDSPEIEDEDVWRMIVMATIAEDWATVRTGAAKLGMPLQSTEGPIEEEWHLIRAVLPAPDGSRREVLALRTGPATARLLVAQPRGVDYNVNDIVVIDPTPLEPVPEDEQERERFIIPFAAVAMLRSAGYTSWFFDGAAPSEQEWVEFNQVLDERGWAIWVYSDDDYTVTHPGTGERLPGVYGWVAVPPNVTPREVDALLDDATERWTHPLAWLDLAREVGIEVERHERIVKEYGL